MCLEKTLSVELTAFTFGKSTNKTATRGEPVEDIRILEIGKPDENKNCSTCLILHGVTSDGTGAAVVVGATVVVGAAVVVGVPSDTSDSDAESGAEEHDAASKATTKNPPNLFIYFLPTHCMPILQVARNPAFEEIIPPKKAGVTGIGADDTRSGAMNLVPLVSDEPGIGSRSVYTFEGGRYRTRYSK